MANRLATFHKIAALADEPTLFRRSVSAAVAGAFAFLLTQLLLGVLWGAGPSAALFSSVALGVAAAVAVVTMKRVMAVVYGIFGAIWLLLECLVLALGCIAAALG